MTFYVLLIAAVVMAAAIGGMSERVVAAMLVAATIASKIVAWGLYDAFRTFEIALFGIDVVLLLGLLAVALRSNRYWPIWLTSLHTYTVIAHLGRLADPDTIRDVYLMNGALTVDPGLIVLMVGSWRQWQRRRSSLRLSATDCATPPPVS